jgi:hypothetical protein
MSSSTFNNVCYLDDVYAEDNNGKIRLDVEHPCSPPCG